MKCFWRLNTCIPRAKVGASVVVTAAFAAFIKDSAFIKLLAIQNSVDSLDLCLRVCLPSLIEYNQLIALQLHRFLRLVFIVNTKLNKNRVGNRRPMISSAILA